MGKQIPTANVAITTQYLSNVFHAIDSKLDELVTDSANFIVATDSLDARATQITTSLVRAAQVQSTISASTGYPDIGSGTIKLLSLDDPATLEGDTLPAFTFRTSSYAANVIVFVVKLNDSYFVIS